MSTPTLFELEPEMDASLTKARKGLREPIPRGYAALPGTGPEGETCKSCAHLTHRILSRPYIKCGLMKSYWTGGRGSDILARAPACKRWEKREQH